MLAQSLASAVQMRSESMNENKVAAIWCRVSTHDQRELSLD